MKFSKEYLTRLALLGAALGIPGAPEVSCMEGNLGECLICLEEMKTDDPNKPLSSTACGHKFHTNCMTQWLNEKHECPMCKTETTMENAANLSFIPSITKDTLDRTFNKEFTRDQVTTYNQLFRDCMEAQQRLSKDPTNNNLMDDAQLKQTIFDSYVQSLK